MARRSPREWSLGNAWARTHGLYRAYRGEYNAWSQAKQRCYMPANTGYAAYGGRGIKMCDEWRDNFIAFLHDVGPRPSPEHQLERIDVNGNYEPGNCTWATVKEQARNRRRTRWVEFACRKMSLIEACELAGIPYGTISKRMWRMKLTFYQAIAYERAPGPGRKASW